MFTKMFIEATISHFDCLHINRSYKHSSLCLICKQQCILLFSLSILHFYNLLLNLLSEIMELMEFFQLFIQICFVIVGLCPREAPQGCCSTWSTWTEFIKSFHHRGAKLNLRELLMSSHFQQHQSSGKTISINIHKLLVLNKMYVNHFKSKLGGCGPEYI